MLNGQMSSTTKGKFQIKKVKLSPMKEQKFVKKGSFKSTSSQNSKSPTLSTVPSFQNIVQNNPITEPPKIHNSHRRSTFTVLDSDKLKSPRIIRVQKKGQSLTKITSPIVPIDSSRVRGSIVNNMRKTFIDTTRVSLLSDQFISMQNVHTTTIKLKGFNMGDKSFDIELNEMTAKFGDTALLNLILKGDKECRLKDAGVAQLVFNFQKNGRRIVGLDLQLNWNDITDIGAKHIGNGLTYLPNLRNLKLHLGHNKFGRRSAECIANGIRSLPYLQNLFIDITNYGMELKMEDEGVNQIYGAIATLRNLKGLKLIISGQQISTSTFDNLNKALVNKPKLASLVIDKDFGKNEEYLGISETQFQSVLNSCPNLVHLKICRLSFTKNTKQIRTEFFLSLHKQEYLTDISVLFTNGYYFMTNDQSYKDIKQLCQERKKGVFQLLAFNKLMQQNNNMFNSSRLIDDLYDIQPSYHSSCNSILDDGEDYDNYQKILEENYDSFY